MNLKPKTLTSDELNFKKEYICPLCRTQSSSKNRQALWVLCPMVEYNPIAETACYDYQEVARAKDFENHPQNSLFTTVARIITRKDDKTLRQTCLNHQKEMVNQLLTRTRNEETIDDLLDKLAEINKASENINL